MHRAAALLALGASLTGCPAYLISGIGSGSPGKDLYALRAEEPDARLRCGDDPCGEVKLERPYRTGRSNAAFWVTFAVELVAGGALYEAGLQTEVDPGSGLQTGTQPGPVSVLGAVLTVLAIADVIGYAVDHSAYGNQYEMLRLQKPVLADWRGERTPLALNDMVAKGATEVPATFSIDAAVRHAKGELPAPQGNFGLVGQVAAAAKSMLQAAPSPTAAPPAPQLPALAKGGKLAVLDFKSYAKDLAQEDVRYFTDVVRGATLKAAPQLDVMTRENLLVLLQASGKDPASCEGECEVDTGRRIGADAVISGDILKVGTHYKLTLRLHETRDGRLLSSAIASGKTIDELDEGANKAAADLFVPPR